MKSRKLANSLPQSVIQIMNLANIPARNACKFTLLGVLCLLSPTMTVSAAKDRIAGPIPAIVERVADGDTVKVRAKIWLDQELEISVRVAGIDAPELYRPKCKTEKQLARDAKLFVQRFFKDNTAFLYNIENGKYAGRVVANLTNHAGDDLAKSLVAKQHAVAAKRGQWCEINGS